MSTPTRLSRSLEHADSKLADCFLKAESEFEAAHPGVNIIVVESFRPQVVQDAYFAQGRQQLPAVNELRLKAGLPAITQSQNRIITYNRKSKHSSFPSKAIDIAFVVNKSTDYKNTKRFEVFAKIMRRIDPSITWGGDWNRNGSTKDERFLDYPHFEVR
jgi:peptidoglycan L-alanyl-D-glutamate endopeptidase CwlK